MKRSLALFLISAFMISALSISPVQMANALEQAQEPFQPESGQEIYLPVILAFRDPPVYGVETLDFQNWKMIKASAVDVHWLRQAAFDWDRIEPVRNAGYNWSAVDEAGIARAASQNLTLIGTIKFTPSWAQKKPPWACGAIKQEALDDFARFVSALVARYSAPPYNIRYWEFGNEVDVDPALLGTAYRNVYGCWGDERDPYYGGGYYAEMLKKAYPAVKSVSPASRVLIGGLLLDCDPTHPPPTKTCLPAKFLEGILRNGGAPYFDIVSFHTYVGFGLQPPDMGLKIRDLDNPSFIHRGGQIVGKVDFLRSVLSAYGVSKPLFLTEMALSCNDSNSAEKFCTTQKAYFRDLQADFVVTSYLRSWALGLWGSIWYTLEDSYWRDVGLLDDAGNPKPGYDALQFMTAWLADAEVKAEIKQYPGLKGYTFQLPTKKISVLWAPDGVTGVSIPLPAGTTSIFDKFGNAITPSDPIFVVHPTYFELPP